MKLKSLFSILCLLIIVSCSSDEDSNGPSEPVVGDYFPSTVDDTWIYSVENTSATNPELDFSATDLVTVNSVSGNSYTLEVNNGTSLPNGTANAIFNSGTLTKSDSTLEFSGNLPILQGLDVISDIAIDLVNFTVYDLNASTNEVLAEISNTISEDIDIDGTQIPLSITYTLTNKKKSNLNSLVVDGETFSNVIHTEIILNVSVNATFNIGTGPTSVEFLEAQDVLVINNYFAEDVGLIKSQTNQSYMLSNEIITLIGIIEEITIDFPTSSSIDNVQELDSYILN